MMRALPGMRVAVLAAGVTGCRENTPAEQDADALHGIKAWGFAQWAALDETLTGIAAALGAASGDGFWPGTHDGLRRWGSRWRPSDTAPCPGASMARMPP